MTGPQPGVGSPIVQTPILRPTDVVREPGLDQSNELPPLAKLLMAKGQLALEQEKFQNEVAQQKQKKQTLDQLNQHLSGLFQGQGGMPETMGNAAGALAGAGETGGAAAALRTIPGLQQQEQTSRRQQALGVVLNDFVNSGQVRDPAAQAEMLLHAAAIDPDAAFRISEGLKNLHDPEKPQSLHVNLGNDGALYGTWATPDGQVHSKKLQDTGMKNAPSQQVSKVAAAQTIQDITDMEALMAKDPKAAQVPITAAMLEGAKTGGGFMAALAGGLEPLAKGQYSPAQLQFRRLKLNFIDHYAAAVIGRRAAGSPATMKLVMDGFFPAAGEEDPSVQTAATQLRARTKQLMLNMVNGKPVDLSTLPGFAQLTSELQQQGGVTTPAPASPGQPPLDFNQLLQGPPNQTPQQPEEEQ